MNADYFAYSEFREQAIYREMVKSEKDPGFREILDALVRQEHAHYQFWLNYSSKKDFHVSFLQIFLFKLMRKVLGLTFTLKFIEGGERDAIQKYNAYLSTVNDPQLRERIKEIIEHEEEHERKLISTIKEEKVEFISNIILGVNDGLIELTGALVGFSFALRKPDLIALIGFITGLAASLSMASSAYMQAQYEEGKNAVKSALYTGMAYIIVVCVLILPFLILPGAFMALGVMLLLAILIIACVSYYTSVIFERVFLRQFSEMTVFSIGIAFITFVIGLSLRYLFDIEV